MTAVDNARADEYIQSTFKNGASNPEINELFINGERVFDKEVLFARSIPGRERMLIRPDLDSEENY